MRAAPQLVLFLLGFEVHIGVCMPGIRTPSVCEFLMLSINVVFRIDNLGRRPGSHMMNMAVNRGESMAEFRNFGNSRKLAKMRILGGT